LGPVGVDRDQAPTQRIDAEPERLQRLGAEQARRALVGEECQHRAFAPQQANSDFRDVPGGRRSGREDNPLLADGSIAHASKQDAR
jgi:hypothetical protein